MKTYSRKATKTFMRKKTIINSMQFDVEITSLCNKLSQRQYLSNSNIQSIFNISSISNQDQDQCTSSSSSLSNIFNILLYIFNKPKRNPNDIFLLQHYLTTFPTFTKNFNLKLNSEQSDLLRKIAQTIQCEPHISNSIIFLNGEPGDKFYIILSGAVSVLVPIEYHIMLTEKEYIDHIHTLFSFKEYDLVMKTIKSNRLAFSNNEIYELYQQTEQLCSKILKDNEYLHCDVQTYINRIIPLNTTSTFKSKPFVLWKYHEVTNLSTGNTFGDIALSKEFNRRTATILAIKDTFFGTIKRDVYQTCIRDVIERIRKNNVEALLRQEIFSRFNLELFDKFYFNFFEKTTIERGDVLIAQHTPQMYIYFIKSGEIEVSTSLSFNKLNDIITYMGGGSLNDDYYNKLAETNEMLNKYYKSSVCRYLGLCILKEGEVIGLDDYVMNGKFYIQGKCVSQTCEVFMLKVDLLERIINKEGIIRERMESYVKKKREMIVERMCCVKEGLLRKFYNGVKEKDYDNWKNKRRMNEKYNNDCGFVIKRKVVGGGDKEEERKGKIRSVLKCNNNNNKYYSRNNNKRNNDYMFKSLTVDNNNNTYSERLLFVHNKNDTINNNNNKTFDTTLPSIQRNITNNNIHKIKTKSLVINVNTSHNNNNNVITYNNNNKHINYYNTLFHFIPHSKKHSIESLFTKRLNLYNSTLDKLTQSNSLSKKEHSSSLLSTINPHQQNNNTTRTISDSNYLAIDSYAYVQRGMNNSKKH